MRAHRDDQLETAATGYREVLANDPGNIDALHFLGFVSFQRGRFDEAEALISRALALNERKIRQGYLEMSGANPVRQMMAMIETTRAFEANTRMIQNQDTMLGALISRVLQA